MTVAFVLLKVTPGKERKVFEDLKGLADVKEVCVIFGDYDLHLTVELPNVEELDEFVFDTLRLTKHIQSTTTLVCTQVHTKE